MLTFTRILALIPVKTNSVVLFPLAYKHTVSRLQLAQKAMVRMPRGQHDFPHSELFVYLSGWILLKGSR